MEREKKIIKTSIIGIIANLFLVAFKLSIGFITNSIAIIMDAINNLSDALSSVITIVATKLSAKRPDDKHPFGYGRIENLSAITISVIVLYAGITAFTESVKKIIHPEQAEYSLVSLIIITAAIIIKLLLGIYVKKVGKEVDSDNLIASGTDAMLDSIISTSTLIAAAIFLLWGLSLEAWFGAVISLIIIKSGIELLKDSISQILGEKIEGNLVTDIKKTICSFPDVHGAYDLIIHNYGPQMMIGSVHIEVDDTYTMDQLDHLERTIMNTVFEKHHVALEGIGIYSRNTHSNKSKEANDKIRAMVTAHEYVVGMHGFYYNEETMQIHFDAVISFSAPKRHELLQSIIDEVQAAFPDFKLHISMDGVYTE